MDISGEPSGSEESSPPPRVRWGPLTVSLVLSGVIATLIIWLSGHAPADVYDALSTAAAVDELRGWAGPSDELLALAFPALDSAVAAPARLLRQRRRASLPSPSTLTRSSCSPATTSRSRSVT